MNKRNITYKYIRVRQLIPNATYAEYWEFVDGKLYDTVKILSNDTIEEPSYIDYIKRIQEDFV